MEVKILRWIYLVYDHNLLDVIGSLSQSRECTLEKSECLVF
jgi:hypothetical protein